MVSESYNTHSVHGCAVEFIVTKQRIAVALRLWALELWNIAFNCHTCTDDVVCKSGNQIIVQKKNVFSMSYWNCTLESWHKTSCCTILPVVYKSFWAHHVFKSVLSYKLIRFFIWCSVQFGYHSLILISCFRTSRFSLTFLYSKVNTLYWYDEKRMPVQIYCLFDLNVCHVIPCCWPMIYKSSVWNEMKM